MPPFQGVLAKIWIYVPPPLNFDLELYALRSLIAGTYTKS